MQKETTVRERERGRGEKEGGGGGVKRGDREMPDSSTLHNSCYHKL